MVDTLMNFVILRPLRFRGNDEREFAQGTAAVLQGDSRGRGCRVRCVSARDRKRGLVKARTDIYFVDPRAFANDIPFEMESPPESAHRWTGTS